MSDGQVRSIFADWNDVNYRVDYVLSRMGRCYGVSARMTSRAYYLASRLLGLDYESTRHMTILWRAGAGADPLVAILGGMVPRDEGIGFVYHAICPRFAGVVKVGFTTQPEERAQSLSSRYGSPVTITRQWPGTMLDEHVEHCRLDAARRRGLHGPPCKRARLGAHDTRRRARGIAQLVERRSPKPQAVGSSPPAPAIASGAHASRAALPLRRSPVVFRMHGEWFEAGPHLFASVPATPPVASASPDHAAEKSVGTDTPLEPSPAAPPPPPAVGAKTVPAPIPMRPRPGEIDTTIPEFLRRA